MVMFQRAEKQKAKLRLALTGVSGGGKTFSALVMAKELGGRTVVIDSERSSALLYADLFDFDHADLTNHSMEKYREAIKAAADAKYDTLIIDSLSHEWAGRGGVLEQVDRAKGNGNGFNAWNGPSQQHNSLIDDLLLFPGHVIVTMRKKADYVLEEQVKNGKKIQVPKKVGMAVVQREGVEFEFTVLLSMERDGSVIVEKSRCAAVEERAHTLRREELKDVAVILRDWLAAGKDVPPPSKPIDDLEKKKGIALARFATSATEPELEAVWRDLVAKLPKPAQDELTPPFKENRARIRAAAQKPNPTPPNGEPVAVTNFPKPEATPAPEEPAF